MRSTARLKDVDMLRKNRYLTQPGWMNTGASFPYTAGMYPSMCGLDHDNCINDIAPSIAAPSFFEALQGGARKVAKLVLVTGLRFG